MTELETKIAEADAAVSALVAAVGDVTVEQAEMRSALAAAQDEQFALLARLTAEHRRRLEWAYDELERVYSDYAKLEAQYERLLLSTWSPSMTVH